MIHRQMADPAQTHHSFPPNLRWQSQAAIAAWFCLAAFITRFPAFFRSVMDHDESLYFLMAEQWRSGHLPYTTIWDNKPPGIYAIFLLFQYALGDHVWAIRIAAVCFISATAFTVFQIARHIPEQAGNSIARPAIFAGAAYIVCSLSNEGLAANTEIFMDCFTALAMLCALSPAFLQPQPLLRGFICGFCFGVAVMIKYVAVFEAPAVAFALLFLTSQPAKFRLCTGAICGAALPLGLTILIYASNGHLQDWWDDSITSNFSRIDTKILPGALAYAVKIQAIYWLPLYAAAAALCLTTAWQCRAILGRKVIDVRLRFQIFLLLWLTGGFIGVASAKSFYAHYFLQILPVLCVILAWAVNSATTSLRRQSCLMVLLLVIPAVSASHALIKAAKPNFVFQNGRISLQPDTEAGIAQVISTAHPPNQVYVFDAQPIIYSLVRQTPPTHYAFPSILSTCFFAHVAGIRATDELRRILTGKPEFIVIDRYPVTDPNFVNQAVYSMLSQVLATRYQLWHSYNNAVLYRLAPGNTAPIIAPTVPQTCKTGQ